MTLAELRDWAARYRDAWADAATFAPDEPTRFILRGQAAAMRMVWWHLSKLIEQTAAEFTAGP